MTSKLEKSEIVVSSILANLLERGLSEGKLSWADLELPDEFREHFVPSVVWLKKEGFIRCRLDRFVGGGAHVSNPCLTARGFSVLGRSLTSSGDAISVEAAVKQVAAEKKGYSQLGDLVGGILGGFTKSMSS